MVVDAPVGCYSLPATATINYTDALAELPNLASSNITEVEVTLDGTTSKVLNVVKRVTAREDELQHHKQVVVVSSQESELIGADHVMSLQRKYPEAMYFTTHSFEENEWQSRDTSLIWLYQERKRRQAVKAGLHLADNELFVAKPALKPTLVNIIGPTYSCFNSYADLHEIKRLIRGVGGEIHFVFPFEAHLPATWISWTKAQSTFVYTGSLAKVWRNFWANRICSRRLGCRKLPISCWSWAGFRYRGTS